MRIENTSIFDVQKPVQPKSGSPASALAPGDELKVKVLFSENGSANLKTEDGSVIHAKLDPGTNLSAGAEATVVVTDVLDGVAHISLKSASGETPPALHEGARLGSVILDSATLEMAKQLDSMKLPVTEQTVLAMKELLAANPSMSLEEAAFIASNNIPREQSMLEAASRLVSGDAKTAQMLAELAKLLTEAGQDGKLPEGESVRRAIESAYSEPGQNADTSKLVAARPQAWTEWLGKFIETQARVFTDGASAQQTARLLPDQTRQSSPEQITQSSPEQALKVLGELSSPDLTRLQTAAESGIQPSEALSRPQSETQASHTALDQELNTKLVKPILDAANTAADMSDARVSDGASAVKPTGNARAGAGTEPVSASGEEAVRGTVSAGQSTEGLQASLSRTLLSLLSQMPAFEELSGRRMNELTNLLVNTAGDFASVGEGPESPPEKLAKIIDGLFTRLDAFDGKEGEALRRAVDELYVRLSLFSDALENSTGAASTGKAAAVAQTEKLLQHVRVLESIEQFACIQLPVEMNGERKNAELYVYRQKKGSRRIDPENVKILLALDMTYTGHLETFINIRGKDVSLEMEVENAEVEGFFKQNTIALHKLLSEAGFRLADTKIRQGKDETTVGGALLALFEHEKKFSSGIDYMV